MSIATLFGFGRANVSNEIPDIYPFPYKQIDFVSTDVVNGYSRILIDVVERVEGIPSDEENLLWDNCLASEKNDGLITLLSKAMCDKRDLFVVYNAGLKLVREADAAEQAQIRADYKAQGKSSVGVYITFKNYTRSDMVKLYSALEYCAVAGLSKAMNLANAIQLKLTGLRSDVGLSDSAVALAQAKEIAEGLKEGRDVAIDAKDLIETAKPDLTATNSAMVFITEKRSFYLGMPAAYITGKDVKSMGDTGVGVSKAIERGLKNYYFSIIKPVLEALFGIKTTFKSEDFEQITSATETLKTFDVTSEDLISKDNKTVVINKLFGLPPDSKGDKPKPVNTQLPPPGQVPAPGAPPVAAPVVAGVAK